MPALLTRWSRVPPVVAVTACTAVAMLEEEVMLDDLRVSIPSLFGQNSTSSFL
jgi:hypothetical protein